MCKAVSIQQVNMATIERNDDASFDLNIEASRNAQRSFGSSGASMGIQTSRPYERPSMRGWWICSNCKNEMNPALSRDSCSICGHRRCRHCFVYQN